MSTPTPVILQDLMTLGTLINLFNDGVETQLVSPRNLGTQRITVQVTDDPLAVPFDSGVADANVASKLSASGGDFSEVSVGDVAINTRTGIASLVTVVDSAVLLTLAADIFPAGTEAYKVIPVVYWTQRHGLGEWKRSNAKTGNDVTALYPLTVTSTGTADTDTLNSLVDSAADFVTDAVQVGYTAWNLTDGGSALITAVTDLNTLVLGTTDLFPDGDELYTITEGDTLTQAVHSIVYPVADPTDAADYPPITSAETA